MGEQWKVGTRNTRPRQRLDRFGLLVATMLGVMVGGLYAVSGTAVVDADMVWRTSHAASYYGPTWAADAASRYVYPPPLAQVVGLLPLTWPVFIVGWEAWLSAALWVALREWTIPVLAIAAAGMAAGGMDSPLASPLTGILAGNIQTVVAASLVIAFRHPAAASIVILTKVAPGISVLWFACRREWRPLGIAFAFTSIVVLVSALLNPGAWIDFAGFAVRNVGTPSPLPLFPVPVLVRLPLVAGAILWAAKTNRPWAAVLAAGFATPALYTWSWVVIAATSAAMWWRGSDEARHR
jgi:hypothetical protein